MGRCKPPFCTNKYRVLWSNKSPPVFVLLLRLLSGEKTLESLRSGAALLVPPTARIRPYTITYPASAGPAPETPSEPNSWFLPTNSRGNVARRPTRYDVMAQSTTFRELRLQASNHFIMARLLHIWSECESDGTTSVTSAHMLWLDKEGHLMEAKIRHEVSDHICKDVHTGCLYTIMNPTIIPARSERRTAPSDFRLYFTEATLFKKMLEYRSTMHFPDDSFMHVPFTEAVSSMSVPVCYSDITGCVTHITQPLKVNSDVFMFQIHLEDISGNKGLVSYIGKGIKEFIRSADYKEVHYPLIITATAITRNVHEFTHIPPFCFVASPGSRLIVHPYNAITQQMMHRYFRDRLPVDIIDYSSKERLGYLRREIPPRISLLELKSKLPLGEEETEAECESGNERAKVVLNHEAALALIRMPPLDFQTMAYNQRIQLLKECCNIKFMTELYIIGAEYSDEPQIRMSSVWHSKAFQPLLKLKLQF